MIIGREIVVLSLSASVLYDVCDKEKILVEVMEEEFLIQFSVLQWGALHRYRLAGSSGVLRERSDFVVWGQGRAWEGLLEKLQGSAWGFVGWNCSLAPWGPVPEWQWEHPGKSALGFPTAICLCWNVRLSVDTASYPSWFSTGNWGDLEREDGSRCLN